MKTILTCTLVFLLRLNDFATNHQDSISSASALNTSCVPANVIEANRKTVNDIYLRTWAEGILPFSSMDSTTLYNIAYQNPLIGGDGVYSARVMLGIDVNDIATGNKTGQPDISEVKNSFAVSKIYPNPNSGTMQLDYFLDDGIQGELIIYDLTGRKIKEYKLINEKYTLSISEGALKNGIYFYEIIIDNRVIDNGKIVIIK